MMSHGGEPAMTSLAVEELRALLALQLVPGLGPLRTRALLEHLGSAQAVLRAGLSQLLHVPSIGEQLAFDIIQGLHEVDVDAELKLIEKHGVELRVRGQDDYPPAVAEIRDAPHLLYLRGSLQESDARAVALVGSRHCTDYGRRTATRLAAE